MSCKTTVIVSFCVILSPTIVYAESGFGSLLDKFQNKMQQSIDKVYQKGEQAMDDAYNKGEQEVEKNIDNALTQNPSTETTTSGNIYSNNPPPSAGSTSPTQSPQYNHALVSEIQWRLTSLGYQPGPVDGAFGSKTSIAIRSFEQHNGLPISGQPTHSLMQALRSKEVSVPQQQAILQPMQAGYNSTESKYTGTTSRYGDQTAFQTAAFKLGEVDAMHQICEGQRPDYRERYDALVTKAHPGFRDQALSVYDQQYKTYTEALGPVLASTCTPAHNTHLEHTAAMYFSMLEPGAASPAPTAVSAQNTPSSAPTATVSSTNAASTTPPVSAPTATASAGSTATSAQANAGPHGTARALAQAHSNECKSIYDEIVPAGPAGISVVTMQNESDFLVYRDSSHCQSDCNKAVQAINSVDRTHPNYMSTHELPQVDVDRSIATCNNSYDTAIASYKKKR